MNYPQGYGFAPPPPASPPKRASSPWKWIGLGCGGLLVVTGVFVAVIYFFVMGVMKSSDVYRYSLASAQACAELKTRIGDPIEPTGGVSGSIQTSGDYGSAHIHYDVHGPRGDATIEVDARKDHTAWIYDTLVAHPKDGAGDVAIEH